MRSTVFPFSVILQWILKRLIFIYPNLNYYRHSVSILLIVKPLSVLKCPERKLKLRCCVAIFYFCLKNFVGNLQGVSSFFYS